MYEVVSRLALIKRFVVNFIIRHFRDDEVVLLVIFHDVQTFLREARIRFVSLCTHKKAFPCQPGVWNLATSLEQKGSHCALECRAVILCGPITIVDKINYRVINTETLLLFEVLHIDDISHPHVPCEVRHVQTSDIRRSDYTDRPRDHRVCRIDTLREYGVIRHALHLDGNHLPILISLQGSLIFVILDFGTLGQKPIHVKVPGLSLLLSLHDTHLTILYDHGRAKSWRFHIHKKTAHRIY